MNLLIIKQNLDIPWMYNEESKAITGTKNIDCTSYTFNKYGEVVTIPKNET